MPECSSYRARAANPLRMNPDLEKLVRLHHVDADLKRIEAELAEIPHRRTRARGRAGARSAAASTPRRAALDVSQKAGARQHEAQLQDLETKRSKYKGQLMEVKTNKEYTAMLHEIEGVEREIRGREDQILAEMEKAETLAAEVKTEEIVFKAVETAAQAGRGRARQRRRGRLESQAVELRAERDSVAASVPEETRELFQRIAKLRGTASGRGARRPCARSATSAARCRCTGSRRNERADLAVPAVQPHPLLRAASADGPSPSRDRAAGARTST